MIDEILLEAESKMDGSMSHAREEFAAIRTGRASSAMFNRVTVDYYGAPTPLTQLASIGIPEPRMVIVKPFDSSQMGDIERAIRNSDLGLNPANEGTQLRLNLPPMTEERRRDMVKRAKTKGEDAKIAIRNVRRKAKEEISKLVKDSDVSEDEGHSAEKELDDLTSGYVTQIDELMQSKENELLEF
ncbi:ribosome recycling factor [Haloglycomyces albus]|uniref:ribosome recycling factor n=1 Tax=Haloglycomyces albus TaxID=526067 RepID=UPI00046CFBED|nr:ribosome recycling factor [Haloglycomyces albus]